MVLLAACLAMAITLSLAPSAFGEEIWSPEDPIAAIDGEPVFLGELNLILTARLKVRDLDRVNLQARQATAALLVRRHLALKSLRDKGGDALQAIIDRQIASFASEARRRGSSLEKHAQSRMADQKSLEADIAWRAAWGQYLKSQLNEKNLRHYYQRERATYAGGRWEVSQIFIEMDATDETSIGIAQKRMQNLAAQLQSADSPATAFASAAREHSDAGSASEGGMVGWVENDGDLPSAVMRVVRETKVGEISRPVRSPLGLHLILVHQFQPRNLSFDELTDQAQLRRDAADALFDALVKQQSEAKVVWFNKALRPPTNVSIIPE